MAKDNPEHRSPEVIFESISHDKELVGRLAKLAQADQFRSFARKRWIGPLYIVIGAVYAGFLTVETQTPPMEMTLTILAGGAGGGILYLFSRFIWKWQAARREKTVGLYNEAKELQESIQEDFVNKLIRINFKYIDIYYEQTREQANKSFWLSAIAALTGLIIISAGISMLFAGAEKMTAGIVATAAGALSEFIAAVFFYLYNSTVTKMSDYHRKLVVTQNISLALKVIDELPVDSQTEARNLLISRLTEGLNKILVADKD